MAYLGGGVVSVSWNKDQRYFCSVCYSKYVAVPTNKIAYIKDARLTDCPACSNSDRQTDKSGLWQNETCSHVVFTLTILYQILKHEDQQPQDFIYPIKRR
jgi:ribosomal protein L37AE/L43A